MNNGEITRFICLSLVFLSILSRASAEGFTDAIHAHLQQCIEVEKRAVAIVVGIVDEHGSRVVSCGKLDNGTDQGVDGDAVFEIGSVGKTFTVLLLQDMIERGEMTLDDPVARYLPRSVKVPTRNGKEITLHHLATHCSGLPKVPDNLEPKRADNPYADYTVEKMYAFLSGYQLTQDPGAESRYSNLGMGLLGHVIALKAGTDYESLVVERICRPLKMDSTRITLSPELKARFATPHNSFGEAVPSWDIPTLGGAGALRSTANDLLKYVSANLGLTPSGLTPLMGKTHDTGLAWFVRPGPQGTKIVSHGGGTAGHRSFVGFDKTRRRGVVVLASSAGAIGNLGEVLLESEWQPDRRPADTGIGSQVYGSYVGEDRRSPDSPQLPFMMRPSRLGVPKAAVCIPAGICLAALVILLWRAGGFRKRRVSSGCAVLAGGLLAALITLVPSHGVDAPPQPSIGIRREGDRLLVRATGPAASPFEITAELLPESTNRCFERLRGTPVTFSRDARGKVIGLTLHHRGSVLSYERISDQPPKAPEPPRPRRAVKLDTKLLGACVGHFEFAPNVVFATGMKVTIWREGDQLFAQAWVKNAPQGAFEIYPESETVFFDKVTGTQSTFIENDRGEVVAVVLHAEGQPDYEGRKLSN